MIYMLGGAGYHNFGDELMVRGWLDFFRTYRPGEKVWVDGASKSALIKAFGADYPEVSFTDSVSVVADRTDLQWFWPSFLRGLTFFKRGGFDYHPKEKADAKALLEAEIIHLHGGGYLNVHFPRKAFLLGTAIAASRLTGAKLIGTGIGILPLTLPNANDRPKTVGSLDQFDFLELRDPESAAILRDLFPNARLIDGVDDTFLAPMAYDPLPGRNLHLSWNDGEVDTAAYRRAEEYVRNHHADYDRVIFWNCAKNDGDAWKRLQAIVPGIQELTFQQLLTKPFPVAPGDHMLTARFHPHMIAARGGAVGGFHSPGKYYDVKHGSILKLGSGFFKIEDEPIRPDMFEAVTNTLMPQTDEYRARKLGRAVLFYTEVSAPKKAVSDEPSKAKGASSPKAGRRLEPPRVAAVKTPASTKTGA